MQSASSASLTFNLNATSTLSLTFDAGSADGQAIYSTLSTTLPVVRLARDQVTVFTGPLESLDASVGDGGEISATFTDWTGIMSHWRPYGTYKAQTANTIVDGLLALSRWPGAQKLTRSGSVTSKASVSRAEQSSVLEEITQAAAAAPFDWYVDHANGNLKIASIMGSDKSGSIVFGAGEVPGGPTFANSQSARVTFQPPLNTVWATSGKGKVYSSTDATSISNYGEFFEQIDAGNGNAQAVADARKRVSPQEVIEVVADPQVAPAWLTNYYLGDTVGVAVASRAFSVSKSLRVNQIQVSFDDQLVETSNQLSFEVV